MQAEIVTHRSVAGSGISATPMDIRVTTSTTPAFGILSPVQRASVLCNDQTAPPPSFWKMVRVQKTKKMEQPAVVAALLRPSQSHSSPCMKHTYLPGTHLQNRQEPGVNSRNAHDARAHKKKKQNKTNKPSKQTNKQAASLRLHTSAHLYFCKHASLSYN